MTVFQVVGVVVLVVLKAAPWAVWLVSRMIVVI